MKMYYSRPYHTQERGRSKVGGGSQQHNNPDDSTSKVLNNFSKALGKIFIIINRMYVCLCVPIDLIQCLTYMVLLKIEDSYRHRDGLKFAGPKMIKQPLSYNCIFHSSFYQFIICRKRSIFIFILK